MKIQRGSGKTYTRHDRIDSSSRVRGKCVKGQDEEEGQGVPPVR